MVSSFLDRFAPIDFTRYIERLTDRFTGREWLFEQIDQWLQQQGKEQFYLLTGEPGVGKSAIVAQLIKRWQAQPENAEQGKLAAYHFCRAGDVETVRPGRVLRSIAAQLGKTLPHYGQALKKVLKDVHLNIDVNINIEELSNSRVTGIYIENLKDLDPGEELRLLIQAPLAELPAIYAEERTDLPALKVFLIDSLDEAVTTTGRDNVATLLAALSQTNDLPPWIQFILTARPNSSVLQDFQSIQSYKLEELFSKNLEDIEQYVGDRIQEDIDRPKSFLVFWWKWYWKFEKEWLADEQKLNQWFFCLLQHLITRSTQSEFNLQTRLEQAELPVKTLIDKIRTLSEGNFLYTRLVMDGISTGELSLKNLSALPKNLNEVYQRFLRHRCSVRKWINLYQPLLGTLTVTQEAISSTQLAKFAKVASDQVEGVPQVESAIVILQQFLDEIEDAQGQKLYTIFHQSLREYLLDRNNNHDFWCDAEEEHERVVGFYRKDAEPWNEIKWNDVDAYGLKHLAKHVYNQINLAIDRNQLIKEIDRYRQDLYELVCQPFMQQKLEWSGSHQSFAEDVELAISVADARENPNLVQLIRGYYLSAKLGSLSTNLPPEILGAFAQVGKLTKASGYASLIQDVFERSKAYRLIGEALLQHHNSRQTAKEYMEKAVTAAGQATGEDKVMALSNIAVALAKADIHLNAEEIFEQSVTVAKQIHGKNGIELLSNSAQILARVGYFNKALEVAEAIAIDDSKTKAKTLSSIALALTHKEAELSQQQSDLESQEGWLKNICTYVRRILKFDFAKQAPESKKDRDDKDLQIPQIKALEIFEQAIEAATHSPESAENLALEAKEYTEYSESQRQMVIMRNQINSMMGTNKDLLKQSIAQIKIAKDLVKAGEIEKAQKLLQQAVSIDILDPWYGMAIKVDVALVVSLWGNYAGAAELFKEVEAEAEGLSSWNNSADEVLERIVQAQIETEQLNEALVIAKKINDFYRKSPLLSKIANAKFQSSEPKQALEIFELAVAVANQINNNTEGRSYILTTIVEDLVTGKQFERAVVIANSIDCSKHKIIALGKIAYALAKDGSIEEAIEILDETVMVAEQIEDSPNKATNLGRIAQFLCKVGKKDQANKIFKTSLSLVEKIKDDESKAASWSAIAQNLAQVGQFARSESVAIQIEKLDGQDVALLEALESLAQIQVEAGQFNGAKALAEKIWIHDRKAVVLSRIAHFLEETGQTIESADLFEQAILLAENITYEKSKIDALSLVAQSLAETGQQPKASRMFDQAVAVAERIKLSDSKAQGLSKVALAMAQAGQQTKALEIFNQVIDIFQQIGKDYLANDLIDIPKKLEVLSAIVQDLTQAGEHIKASRTFNEALPEAVKFLNGNLQYKSLYISRIVWAAWNAVQSLVLIGHFDEAMAIAVQMEQIAAERGKAKVLDGIAQALIKTQQFDQAIEVVAQIRNSQDRMETLVKVAHLYDEQKSYPINFSDLQSLFKVARSIDSESVFGVLAGVASHLADIDQGQVLWGAFEEITKIDDWWRN